MISREKERTKDSVVKLADQVDGLGQAVCCPSCGEINLHHEITEVFNRRTEDAKDGLHVLVTGASSTIETGMSANPSPYRDGILIRFSCEHCDANPVMVITQHKGTTYMKFISGDYAPQERSS